jgi:KAP family P-loop domain
VSEIIKLTFDQHDKLGLKPFSEKLERFLMVEHDFVEGGLAVALIAPFGAGKTTFLSMWKTDLDKRRESNPAIPSAIFINAWESDYYGDPFLSVVSGLIRPTGGEETTQNSKSAARLHEAAKDVGWFVTGLANNLVSHWTGIDPVSAGELAEDKKQNRQLRIPDFVTLYTERTKALEKLKNTLREVFGGDVPKAFLFVDELDRCRPDYAISYLETIKHVFDIHGLVFVLAVDYDQLECSAKSLFDTELKFSDYFRKFVQRMISLPEPSEINLQNLARHYVECYFEKQGKRTSLMGDLPYRIKDIVQLIGALRMPPRQIQETFRIIGHTVAGDSSRAGRLLWCLGVGVILMSALKVAEPKMYHLIGRREASHEDVGRFLIRLLSKGNPHWWFCIYIIGIGTNDENPKVNIEKLFKDLGFLSDGGLPALTKELSQFASGWGHHHWTDRWKQIYENIETANTY